MVLTVCFVLSPVIGLFCHRRPADMVLSVPGRANKTSAGLDASVEASGPHDFAVRSKHLSSARLDRSQAETHPAITSRAQRCRVHRIPPRVHDDRDTPLCGVGRVRIER